MSEELDELKKEIAEIKGMIGTLNKSIRMLGNSFTVSQNELASRIEIGNAVVTEKELGGISFRVQWTAETRIPIRQTNLIEIALSSTDRGVLASLRPYFVDENGEKVAKRLTGKQILIRGEEGEILKQVQERMSEPVENMINRFLDEHHFTEVV